MSLNIAAGLGLGGNESYPDLFQPYGGFPDGVKVENSHIVMPELPGIGFEGKSDLIKVMRELNDDLPVAKPVAVHLMRGRTRSWGEKAYEVAYRRA